MRMAFDPDHAAIRAEFARIGRDAGEGPPGAFDQSRWDRLVAAGLWRMIVPREYGGAGVDWWAFTAALEGLASTVRYPGIVLSVIGQAGLVRALELFGTEAQRRRYLPRVLAGELSATAIADPDSGTDVRATSSILTPAPNETFVLDGAKHNIAHAPIATMALIVCKLADRTRDGITLVLVDMDRPGLTCGPRDRKLGNADLPTGGMIFEGMRLDYGHLLGEPGRGLGNLIEIVSLGRLYYGLVAGWLLEAALADAIDYAERRRTFEVPIIEHQYVQKKLTDLRVAIETSRWTAYGALNQLLRGAPEAVMTCSIAKIAGANAVVEGALELVKLHGSDGYHAGPVSDFLRDALAFAAVGGTDEMHRRNVLGQMRRLRGRARAPRTEAEAKAAAAPIPAAAE